MRSAIVRVPPPWRAMVRAIANTVRHPGVASRSIDDPYTCLPSAQTRCRFPFTTTRSGYRRTSESTPPSDPPGSTMRSSVRSAGCAVIVDHRGRVRGAQESGPAVLKPEPVERLHTSGMPAASSATNVCVMSIVQPSPNGNDRIVCWCRMSCTHCRSPINAVAFRP